VSNQKWPFFCGKVSQISIALSGSQNKPSALPELADYQQKLPMNSIGKILLFSALLAICSNNFDGVCQESHRPPSVRNRPQAPVRDSGSETDIGIRLVSAFWKHISAVDSDRCPSLPSCSSYSARAFKKHGFVAGWLMSVDRLIHEGDEGSVSPIVYHNGRAKVLDAVENNDFWWFNGDEANQK
jgi:putative component of membrane protein insertase Oxa1/YidC/SpoIIIJ protein YidD